MGKKIDKYNTYGTIALVLGLILLSTPFLGNFRPIFKAICWIGGAASSVLGLILMMRSINEAELPIWIDGQWEVVTSADAFDELKMQILELKSGGFVDVHDIAADIYNAYVDGDITGIQCDELLHELNEVGY